MSQCLNCGNDLGPCDPRDYCDEDCYIEHRERQESGSEVSEDEEQD